MAYTEVNALRVLAKRMYETEDVVGARWADATPTLKRVYEAHAEKLFDLKNEDTRDALLHLLNRS